ncbi:MAG: SPFH/Band 7/PHB domain protein [Firmicutes bacterium]|nr:SPFH/Band 7/PHB domain protein [Bacillota bacterium]
MTDALIVAVIIITAVLIVGLAMSIRIVPQSYAMVVQRLGKYRVTLETGFNMILPIFDKTLPMISLKEQVADFKPSDVITKDNVKMMIDSIVFFQVIDPKRFQYGIDRPMLAIENLTATTLRNIVGELDLDETLTSRETVNAKMRQIIDEATDPWGIKVHRVELRNILPPPSIQESMERQMRAERERREAILRAEGEKRSSILVAEGEKESAILRAEAQKITLLTEAEGQAQAIERIMKAKPDAAYLTLQGFEALKVLANGEATKIIVPSDLSNVATLFTTVSGMIGEKPKAAPKKK